MRILQFKFADLILITLVIALPFTLADTDPIFDDQKNIQQFLTGYLNGLNLEVNSQEIASITSEQFSLQDFMIGLDYQGLSKLISEKEALGLQYISKTLLDLDNALPNKSKSLEKLIDVSLKTFGNYSKFAAAKAELEQKYPNKDISSFLWDALDFISLYNNFHLSGQIVATVIKELLPLIH